MIDIIIVEDEFPIRAGLRTLIERISSDYRIVETAENFREGFMKIRDIRPDLVLCDIRLGKNSGLDLIEQLQESGVRCHFVIISGYPDFQYAQRAIRLGVQDYLLKPVMLDKLKEMLEKQKEEIVSEKTKSPLSESPAGQRAKEEGKGNELYSKHVSRVVHILETEYSRKLSFREIANQCGVSLEYLSAQFSRETGVTISDYLKKQRMLHAKKLLKESSKKVYEIALATGYEDPQYFCRVFKAEFGISPNSYRLASRSGSAEENEVQKGS